MKEFKIKGRNIEFLTESELMNIGFKSLGKNVLIHHNCVIISPQNISIGDNCRIDCFTLISASKEITIGRYVHIAAHCLILGEEKIEIGNFCGCSFGTKIFSSSDNFDGSVLIGPTIPREFRNVEAMPVYLHDYTIIGAGSVILPGSDLGQGCAIGANSLVKGKIEEFGIYAGSPATFIKKRKRDMVKFSENL